MNTKLCAQLAPIANGWNEAMKLDVRYPVQHPDVLARCHASEQVKPTPLMLRYEAGDRTQSRALVVPLRQGDAIVFAVQRRPVQGTRGMHRVNMRPCESRLRAGCRHTLGIIFHDAA